MRSSGDKHTSDPRRARGIVRSTKVSTLHRPARKTDTKPKSPRTGARGQRESMNTFTVPSRQEALTVQTEQRNRATRHAAIGAFNLGCDAAPSPLVKIEARRLALPKAHIMRPNSHRSTLVHKWPMFSIRAQVCLFKHAMSPMAHTCHRVSESPWVTGCNKTQNATQIEHPHIYGADLRQRGSSHHTAHCASD